MKARFAAPARQRSQSVKGLLALVLDALDDSKALNVVPVDLQGKTSIADYMIVASGSSSRQVISIAENLAERIKHAGFGPCQIEGQRQGDWVVVDAGDVIVHVFRPEVRDYYNLEKLWSVVIPTANEIGPSQAMAV